MEDMPMTSRLRFGIFLAPFHKPGINPTLALQNDLDLVAWLDRLGYDEVWFGEHHSAGTEISASPEIMSRLQPSARVTSGLAPASSASPTIIHCGSRSALCCSIT
jgi:alkanesulfonate monooxygenase SsuD/methylene tetrahydromethanopterin reductase-like flavin-dependent oxidoreductase (luciferase family)